MTTRTRKILIILAVLVLAGVGVGSAGFVVSSIQHGQLVREYVDVNTHVERVSLSPERSQSLPEPVERYFRFAFAEREYIEVASVSWKENGTFMLPVGQFSIRSTQHSRVDSPSYVWRGVYTTSIGIPVIESRDAYAPGKHNMRAKLLGYQTVMDTDYQQPADVRDLHSYLALRYFGTALAYPWALLPGEYHRWEAHSENENQAWLVLDYENLNGRYLVTFASDGSITRMETPNLMLHGNGSRLREVAKKSGYQNINGIMVPTQYEYLWYDEEGNLDSHYQFSMSDLNYNQ